MNGSSPKFCSECGNPLPPKAKFCSQCGQRIHLLADVQAPGTAMDNSPTVDSMATFEDPTVSHRSGMDAVPSESIRAPRKIADERQEAILIASEAPNDEVEVEDVGESRPPEPPSQPMCGHVTAGYTLEGHGLQVTGIGAASNINQQTSPIQTTAPRIATPSAPVENGFAPEPQSFSDSGGPMEPRSWPGGERTLNIVPGMQLMKKLGMVTMYTIICTDQRLVFSKVTNKMLNEEYSNIASQAKSQGKRLLGQIAAQMGSHGMMYDPDQGYARRYWDIQPDMALFEDKVNFMLPVNQVMGIRVQRIQQVDNRYEDQTNYQNVTEVTINASGKTYKFRGLDTLDIRERLASAYPALVH